MEITNQQKDEIKEIVRLNSIIDAVKILKSKYNLSLKEATILYKVIDKEVGHRRPINKVKKPSLLFPKLIGTIFAVIGILFLAISINSYLNDKEIAERSDIIKGVVVENPNQPVIEYESGGTLKTIQAQVKTDPPAFEIGEEVELFVNREDPDDIHINSFMDRYYTSMFFGFIGIIFTVIGSAVVFTLK